MEHMSRAEGTVADRAQRATEEEVQLFPASLPVEIRNYELLEEIFETGPSTWYRARNTILGHPMIVRRLTIDPERAENVHETFYREQRHTAGLNHPRIHRPVDVFEAEGFLWSAHDHWEGMSSTEYVEQRGPLDVATAARLGAQVADALAHMHGKGFVHGKVHPQGIGISDRGDAQIYNLVKSADLAAGIWPLREAVQGLSAFTAPEEHAGQVPTASSDLYGLAMTLCYWITGVEPLDGETVEEWMLRAKSSKAATGAAPSCSDTPGSLSEAMCGALQPDPEQRRGSVDALGSLLVEVHQRLATEVPSGFTSGVQLAPEAMKGPVEILGRHGAGAFGVVLKAQDTLAGDQLAVKALKPEHRDNGEARQRFLREARAMHAVNHDNVVRIHAVGEQRGTPYAIMDFIAGPNLNDVIRLEGKLDPDRVREIGSGIARGLAAIHEQGIVHRDLKPHNILLADGEVPLIADFGVAHELEATRITGTGGVVGTPIYMAPEQFGGEPVAASGDLYALGTMLYEMLTGQPPFAGRDLVQTIRAIREDEPAPLPDDVPHDLAKLVLCLLQKDPAKRHECAEDIAEALEG